VATERTDYRGLIGGTLVDPYPEYRRLREHDPVHWSEPVSSWILTRYGDVAAVLQYDPRITAERLSRLMAQVPPATRASLQPLNDHLRTFVQFYDPPDHSRLRATAAPAFTPRSVDRFRDVVQEVIDSLLELAESKSSIDLITDFAYPLPATVIAEVLGIPPEERNRFKAWADRIAEFFEGVGDQYESVAREANEAVIEMEAFIREQIRQRRLVPRQDLLTRLLGEIDGERLSEAELFGWCMFLLLAGHEKRISRVALESVELDRGTIRAGDRIWAMIGAGNRDPAQFEAPDRIDIRRDPNRHLAFGYGVHFCLGASLARLEGQLSLQTLVQRYPDLRLTGPTPRRPGVSLHQYRTIPVALH
jgi:cytochrome P450